MIVFRLVCAILMAWGVNWVLSRPEAAFMLGELPVMSMIGPACAALVGLLNLASRQGWGLIVAVANGAWAGLLSVLLSGVAYTIVIVFDGIGRNLIRDYESFITLVSYEITPLFELVVDVPLLTLTVAVTAGLGVATELLHWVLVRMRQESDETTRSSA